MPHRGFRTGRIAVLLLCCGVLILGCHRRHAGQGASLQVSAPPAGTPVFTPLPSLASLGYVEQEFFLSGRAVRYAPASKLSSDGKWAVAADTPADYTTRMVVIRPSTPERFNGTVVVEWLNVTSGGDAPAEWLMLHRELLRSGSAYVGISAQRVGVEGGPSLFPGGTPLKRAQPPRYASLHHPGDAYAYDIFSQAGRVVRGAGNASVLGPLHPKELLAAGESQSAAFLTTYVNAVDPLARVYDGFLVHSRFGDAAGLAGAMNAAADGTPAPSVVRIRDDARVPVMVLLTETDLVGPEPSFVPARQPDTAKLRTWEIAGTAHADTYFLGVNLVDWEAAPFARVAAAWRPSSTMLGREIGTPINGNPAHHFVAEAALAHLVRWVRSGEAPPSAPPLEAAAGAPAPSLDLDADGNARGGLRTPWVDVPTARMSGLRPRAPGLMEFVGQQDTFSPARLRQLYPGGKSQYLARFQQCLDRAIRDGFLLPADRAEILALADALYPSAKADRTHP